MGTGAQTVFELALAALTLFQTLQAQNREPTAEELLALSGRNWDLIKATQAGIAART